VIKTCSKLSDLRITPINLSHEGLMQLVAGIHANPHIVFFPGFKGTPVQKRFSSVIRRNVAIKSLLEELIDAAIAAGDPPPKPALISSRSRPRLVPPISYNGYLIGTSGTIGRRPTMDDRVLIRTGYRRRSILLCIFDGHGDDGGAVATCVAQHLPIVLNSRLDEEVFGDAFTSTVDSLHTACQSWTHLSGTTVLTVLLSENTLYCANLGDTRCVIQHNDKSVRRLSRDHKPDLKEERKYIKSKGGFVESGRLNGLLSMSRAIGDGQLGILLNCTPTVVEYDIDRVSRVILACDGVWDVISDEEACEAIAHEVNPSLAAMELQNLALKKGSEDNISIIVMNTKSFVGQLS
jgi:serine/threonine protein phosphatase PrpC